jgi:N-acetylglucosamine-6-sulfatase
MKFQERVPFANDFESRLNEPEYPRMNAKQKAVWDAYFEPRNAAFLASPPTGKELVRWKYQRYIKNYLRCIDSVDENVGRVLNYLDANGLSENTIVIYSSDQGFYLGEHGWYDKRWMYEESMRMPFLIRWPGKIVAGTRNEQLIQNIDYAPTFLEAAGVELPEGIQGKSMMPLYDNAKSQNWRKYVYYHYYEHLTEHGVPRHDGVRGERYKLINFYSNDGWSLYDLETDPDEMTDLSKRPEYQDILIHMQGQLSRLRAQYELPEYAEPATH